ncbi:TPA: hypothetical protein EYN98_22835 [Candidatus Poribacteria bacterium]|nr:hypothetical protein [Candidatus Poribacteria bacterium]HIA68820.1 hypothetical protein [Candidatus Poribacteria bacterium]HIB91706.1 hypothetical protein [Candidatus Poribacteria bacterium]HIC01502.1 hypothetical protein [Candidatus Poribacteria bacterium]HIN29021.1 hypothetical protein [Candidatus Poribacteria bacterium]
MIYVIISTTLAFTAHDNMVCLMGVLPHATFFATAENDWINLFYQYLPDWLVIRDDKTAYYFYKGESAFWSTGFYRFWIKPAIAWSFLISLLFFMLLCISTILRKQWIESERLAYPIIQIPLEMTDSTSGFFQNRVMWIGFSVAGAISLINGLSFIYPNIPRFPIKEANYDLSNYFTHAPWNSLGTMPLRFYPFLIGLSFLIPLDLTFSTWFFYLFRKLERLIGATMGWNIPKYPFFGEQATGAMIGLCLTAIYLGRWHLVEVFRKVIGLDSTLDDKDEPMGYRTAVLSFLGGMVVLMIFCGHLGMSQWLVPLFFGLYFVIAIAMTRMRAEVGPPLHAIVLVNPQIILVTGLGTRKLGTANLTMFSLFYWFNRLNRSHPMPHQLEAFKIAERTGANTSRLFWAMMLALVVGVLLTFWIFPYTLYRYGATTAGELLGAGSQAYSSLSGWLQHPNPPDYVSSSVIGVSFLFSIGMMWMRMRFLRFPFHPAGYVLGVSSGTIDVYWFALFVCWLAKLLILRHGGVRSYRKVLPFFMGLVLGDFVVGCYWGLLSIVIGVPLYTTWF